MFMLVERKRKRIKNNLSKRRCKIRKMKHRKSLANRKTPSKAVIDAMGAREE
jgi:hypothetical protein